MSESGLRGPLRKRESSLWARHPDDWYVEPAWVSERLFAEEIFEGAICDPACGSGNIVTAARAAGISAEGFDIVRRSDACSREIDWLREMPVGYGRFENIVCNPPFRHCDDRRANTRPFVDRCLQRARYKTALLLPANWIQGDQRSRWLEASPLYRVWFLSPRPSMPPGDVLAAGAKPGNGTTDYAWFIWLKGYEGEPKAKWLRRSP